MLQDSDIKSYKNEHKDKEIDMKGESFWGFNLFCLQTDDL